MILLIIVVIIFIIVMFHKKEGYSDVDNMEDYADFNFNFDISEKRKKKKNILGKYFIKQQFHQDYRDTTNTLNLITGKNIEYDGTIEDLIKQFVAVLNAHRNSSAVAWQSVLPETHIEAGWDKQMKFLGLPTTIYNEELKREPLKLIYMSNITTVYDKKNVDIVIKKRDVKDYMAVRISFKQHSYKKNSVKIDGAFTIGFLMDIDV